MRDETCIRYLNAKAACVCTNTTKMLAVCCRGGPDWSEFARYVLRLSLMAVRREGNSPGTGE